MGVHFINFEAVDDVFDPIEPEALVYEPRPAPFADFELHAWIWKGNPNGVFADFNPKVSCPEE